MNVRVSGLSPPTTDVCRTDQRNVNGYLTLWHRKCGQYESDREALSRESSLESGETCDGWAALIGVKVQPPGGLGWGEVGWGGEVPVAVGDPLWWLLMRRRENLGFPGPQGSHSLCRNPSCFQIKCYFLVWGQMSMQLLSLAVGIGLESEMEFPACTGHGRVPGTEQGFDLETPLWTGDAPL